jgi:mannose-6-phosphate isomerase-like protein (cupin superfamily)
MPSPAKYPGTEKGYKKYLKDCLHQTLHMERKSPAQSQAICLNRWREEHGPKHPGKAKRVGSIAGFLRDLASKLPADKVKGFSTDIEKDTIDNTNFRKVLYTGKNSQLVLMSLKPGEDIGEEKHDVDQFFRIEKGTGKVVINGTEHPVKDGSAVVIPANSMHNVINTGDGPLAVYSIYSPPHHKSGTIHVTKEDAQKADEHFDGETTE